MAVMKIRNIRLFGLATSTLTRHDNEPEEPLLARKEVAGLFRISLVTLRELDKPRPAVHQTGRAGVFPPLGDHSIYGSRQYQDNV